MGTYAWIYLIPRFCPQNPAPGAADRYCFTDGWVIVWNWFRETGLACKSTYNVGKSTPPERQKAHLASLTSQSCVSDGWWLCLLIYLIPNQWRDEGLVISSPYACLMHFCMVVESWYQLPGLGVNLSASFAWRKTVHIIVVKCRTYNCIACSGVAKAFPGGQAAHPEDHNEEENKENLRKN